MQDLTKENKRSRTFIAFFNFEKKKVLDPLFFKGTAFNRKKAMKVLDPLFFVGQIAKETYNCKELLERIKDQGPSLPFSC